MLGGYGNFGARICRALSEDDDLSIVPAGRAAGSRLRLDIRSPELAERLKAASPDVVVHCAGPFQGQDYGVARAVLFAGAHYIDLADGRAFVARFAENVDAQARALGRLAVSGASTLPALSSAVVDDLASRFRRIDEVQIAIAPGQRAPRGRATMSAVLGYCGRPFAWLSDGKWRKAWGWQELARLRFAGFGTRWAAACDVPDLELFPARYSSVRTVQFRAALEFSAEHCGLWLAAALRRCGLALPLERWAGRLNRLASALDRFGGDKAGMLVAVSGEKTDGRTVRAEWHLTVDAITGPEIPALPAVLMARKLARRSLAATGAFACMGFLRLADFAPEFARRGIVTAIEERTA